MQWTELRLREQDAHWNTSDINENAVDRTEIKTTLNT